MRTIPANALSKITQSHGTEPIIIIAISWHSNALVQYADRDIGTDIHGKILNASEVDAVIQVSEGAGQSDVISVILDDTDGSIKNIIDNHDIHKRPAYVYQYYQGLDIADKFLLFRGEITTPIVWKEGDRTVSFEIFSKLEDREVGFSPEEGIFPDIPDSLLGQTWPSLFGTVLDSKTVRIDEVTRGTLAQGTGIADFTIVNQIQALADQRDTLTTVGLINILAALFSGPEEQDQHTAAGNAALLQAGQLSAQIQELTLARIEQESYQISPVRIIGGRNFPQGITIALDINGGIFTGSFNGDLFNISGRKHPEFDNFVSIQDPAVNVFQGTPEPPPGKSFLPFVFGTISGRDIQGNPFHVAGGQILGDQAGFFWANAGSEVRLAGDEDLDYVVSIVPGTVLKVSAYRNFEGTRQLITVPSNYYTVENRNYNTINAVIVTLHGALSSRTGEDWDDEVFVTFKSDVGPNVVDILEYLIDTYTDLTTDTASFNSVKTAQIPYPANFGIYDRQNIIDVLQDIAFQARCALWLKNNVFYIKYLPATPITVDSINEDDVIEQTLEVFHTSTNDLVTKLTGTWKESEAAEESNKMILRHNVAKYGILEREIDFYIYNNIDLVRKSATFWLIRWANTWKKLRFTTPLNKLKLETFDEVDLEFTNPYVSSVNIVGFIEKASYNSEEKGLDFEIWTPVRSGESTPYVFAYPAEISEDLIFPTVEERNSGFAGSGGGPAFSAYRDPGLVQIIFVRADGEQINSHPDHGDLYPSDIGDVAPAPPIDADAFIDAGDPGLETPGYGQLAPTDPSTGSRAIDIRKSIIIDSATGGQSILASVFEEIQNGTINLKKEVSCSDSEKIGIFDMEFDEDSGKYKANEGFLGD